MLDYFIIMRRDLQPKCTTFLQNFALKVSTAVFEHRVRSPRGVVHVERALDVLYLFAKHGDDVKAARLVAHSLFGEPLLRRACELVHFCRGDHLARSAELGGRARLDLDENVCAAVLGDNVDFPLSPTFCYSSPPTFMRVTNERLWMGVKPIFAIASMCSREP